MSRWILTDHPHFVVVCGAAFVAVSRRGSMSLMSGAVYLYAELVATVRESRRPFRDSGLCGERMRRPVLPAVGEKASGRGAVSCRLTGAWAFVGRGVRLACRIRFVRLICWSLSFGPSRPTGTGAGFSSVGMESSPDLSGTFLSGRDDRLDCFAGLVSRQVRRLICPVCLPLSEMSFGSSCPRVVGFFFA